MITWRLKFDMCWYYVFIQESYWIKTWRLTNASLSTVSPEKSFNQQLDEVLKLINEYTLAVTSAEELTKAETYTLLRVYCFF
jgi:hypothetical protein